MPNLSDFNPSEITPANGPAPASQAPLPDTGVAPQLNLSDLHPSDISSVPGGVDEAKYGGFGQQSLGALETGLSAATLGGSRGLERLSGIPELSPENQRGRERQQGGITNFISGAGGLVGAGALAALTGGAAFAAVPELMGAAGAGGAAALGLGGEGAALGSRLAAKAVAGAIEGGIFQGGNEVGKMLLSDPNQTVGTAATNGLYSMLGGGLIGGALGSTGELWNAKFGSKVADAMGNAQSEIESPTAAIPDQTSSIFNQSLKENSPELQAAAKRLKIGELTPGTLLEDQSAQRLEGNLSERGSIAGIRLANKRSAMFSGLNEAAQDTLSDASDLSDAQVGKQLKQGIQEKLEAELKPIEAEYRAHEPHLKAIEIPDDIKQNAINQIQAHDFVKQGPQYAKLADALSDRISNLDNVNDLKTARTLLNKELSAAYRTGDPASSMLQAAKDALTEMRAASLNNASQEAVGVGSAEGNQLGNQNVSAIEATDAKYAAYKQKLQGLGVESGTGNLNDARSMLERFKKIPDESFAGRILDTNDSNQMNYFKKNFPEQFELARKAKLGEIKDSAINHGMGKNGQFETSRYLSKVNKLTPEAQAILFPGESAQKINDIRSIYEAIPGAENTSKTAYAQSFAKIFSPEGFVQNVTDAAQYAMLKALPHLAKAAEGVGGDEAAQLAALKFGATPGAEVNPQALNATAEYIRSAIKGQNLVDKATSALFKAGQDVLPSRLIPSDKDKEKLNKKLQGLQTNNSSLFNVGDGIGHYLPAHATAMAQTTGNAVNYINSLRSDLDKKSPLDSEVKESPVQKQKFDQALEIAQQPLVVLNKIKEGTLDATSMIHLRSMYPDLYTKLSNQVQHRLIETVDRGDTIPYKTRLGLSVFLGQPLDSTMTPNAIIAAQPKPMNAPAQNEPSMQSSKGAHSMKSLAKLPQAYATTQQAREASRIKS